MQTLTKSAAVLAVLLLSSATAMAKPAASPFANLAGGWSGGGNASFDGGRNERLRCTANYRPGGNTLSMTIRCANPSLNLQLNGNLHYSGGRVTGSWSESSTGTGGSAVGRASANGLSLRIGGDIAGSLSVSISGASQSVNISASGSAFRRASFNMRRR